MKSVLFNFYIRYQNSSLQDEEESVEILKGYISFYRDVKENIVLSSLATKEDFCDNMDTTYTQCLGNEKLHQDIVEHKEKWENRGICEFAL